MDWTEGTVRKGLLDVGYSSWWIVTDFTEGKRMEETDWGENQTLLWHVKLDLLFSHPSNGIQGVKVRV